MPGSEWLTYKIYSGPKTLENIMINNISHLIEKLFQQKAIDKFFFLKYADPDYHLRIRFHFPNVSKCHVVLQAFKDEIESYLMTKVIWKISVESYTREIERYGNNTIEDIETFFYYNSVAALKIINHTFEEQNGDRWIWGIKYVDLLLDEFRFNSFEKIKFFEILSGGFMTELNIKNNIKIKLDYKYRNSRDRIEKIFSIKDEKQSTLYHSLLESIESSKMIIKKILEYNSKEKLSRRCPLIHPTNRVHLFDYFVA